MVRFPVVARDFCLQHIVQTGSGAHPASYPMGMGEIFLEDKVAGLTTHLQVVPMPRKCGWVYACTAPCAFMV
jgi:hypothetical protein